jgi:hypothetical protein
MSPSGYGATPLRSRAVVRKDRTVVGEFYTSLERRVGCNAASGSRFRAAAMKLH